MFLSTLLALTLSLSPNGTSDRTDEMMKAVCEIDQAGGGILKLAAGDYHFYSKSAAKRSFHVSNHDQPRVRPIFLPLEGMRHVNIVAEDGGADFVFHGMGTAILLDHSEDISIKNVTIRWDKPYYLHATIDSFDSLGRPIVTFAKRDCVALREGYLTALGSDWSTRVNAGILFDGKTHEVVAGTGDIWISGKAESIEGTAQYRLDLPLRKISSRAKAGDVLALRSYYRPHPVICLNHAKDTVLEDCVITDGFGMGVLAQMSENVKILGGGTYPLDSGEGASGLIDANHFSNCRGEIILSGGRFEGMMDDALNVHSTSLGIVDRIDDKTIRCRFMHGQAIGLDLFASGDVIRFIAGKTLENGAELKLSTVKVLDSREVVLAFDESIPERYQVGDAIENASYQPSVIFSRNKVGNNRARGILLTTPNKVVVEDNLFDHVSGAAILLAGDAQGWYESGACHDVTIRNNRFVDCLTSRYQFCDGVIVLYPMVADLPNQVERYHRNVKIEDNVFDTFDVPLLFALSTENLCWRRNKVIVNRHYPGWGRGRLVPYYCENLDVDEM